MSIPMSLSEGRKEEKMRHGCNEMEMRKEKGRKRIKFQDRAGQAETGSEILKRRREKGKAVCGLRHPQQQYPEE